jgi:Fe2+ transport system protein B
MSEENASENIDNINLSEGSINSIPTDARVVKTFNASRGEDIEKMLSQVINLSSQNIVHEPSCQICSSPYRKEIEEKYAEKKSVLETKKFLKDKYSVDLENYFFENHFDFHNSQGVAELQKIEYTQRVKRLYNQSLTTLDRIDSATAMLMERIMGVNSLIPSTEESRAKIEQIKSSETNKLMGTYTNLIKLRAAVCGEMKTSGELITIPAKEFIDAFINAIQSAKSDRERDGFKNLLDRLEALSRKTQL